MQDPRGGQLIGFNHELKTLRGAKEWYESATVEALPLKVQGHKTLNGRVAYTVTDKNGKIVKIR